MKTIREWAFPVTLAIAWMIASVYTVDTLVDAHHTHQRFQKTGFSPHA